MTFYFVVKTETRPMQYGIKIIRENTVRNISTSLAAVQKLADACNSGGVEDWQFLDILENFMADYETF